MKIAVCIYGEQRFYNLGYEYMKNFFDQCQIDYYIHTWSDKEYIQENLEKYHNFYSSKNILIEEYINFENFFEGKNFINFAPKTWKNVISALKSCYELGKLLESKKEEYDFVCFTRSDVAAIGEKIKNLISPLENKKIYSSYVPGPEWILEKDKLPESTIGHIDARMICSNKENMIYFSKLFEYLKQYVLDEKLPLCHHRLMYHHMKNIIKEHGHELIVANSKEKHGGWFYIRSGELSFS